MWPLLASTHVKSQLRGATRIWEKYHYKNVKIIFAEKWVLHRNIPWQSLLHHTRCSNSHARGSPCFWIFACVLCFLYVLTNTFSVALSCHNTRIRRCMMCDGLFEQAQARGVWSRLSTKKIRLGRRGRLKIHLSWEKSTLVFSSADIERSSVWVLKMKDMNNM